MANAITLTPNARLNFRFKVYPIHEYLVMFLFAWYILYPGLGWSGVVPFFDRIDDLIFVLMFGLSILKLMAQKGKVSLHPVLFWTMLALWGVVGISKLYHSSPLSLSIKYTYLISRPLILLLYLTSYDLPVEQLFGKIVRWSRLLILYNLPAIVFNLVRINIKLFEAEYNDAIVGLFPFGNNDSLVWLYSIVLFKDFYDTFIQKRRNRWWWFALEYLLLLSTMSFKYAIVLTSAFGIIVFFRARHRLRNALLLSFVAVWPIIVLFPIIRDRMIGIRTAPVFITAEMIFKNKVKEHGLFIGAGPGAFASPTAFEADSALAHKYGLFEIKRYWEEIYTGPTGTLTRSTSSALTLLSDIGMLGVTLYSFFILFIIKRNYQNMRASYICLAGFAMGMYSLAGGLFLNTWFWGLEIFLVMLSAKYVSDLSNNRR